MSAFDKFINLFVVTEQDTQQAAAKEQKPLPAQSTVTVPVQNVPVTASTDNFFNQQIYDELNKSVKKAKLPDEDYLEFMDALEAMKNIPLDEKIKMQTVLATLSIKGLTVQKIIESADYYITVLNNEKTKFNELLEDQKKKQIVGKYQDVGNTKDQILAKSEQIATLTREIQQLQEKEESLKNEIGLSTQKIKDAEQSFVCTFDVIVAEIKQNVQKVTTFK